MLRELRKVRKTWKHQRLWERRKSLLETRSSLPVDDRVPVDTVGPSRAPNFKRRMNIYRLKIKSLVKVFLILLGFILLIGSLNHSFTRSFLSSEQTLGNYEPLEMAESGGAGQMGRAHHTRASQTREVDAAMAEYGINMVCSSEISLHRTLPDLRHPECKHWDYSEELPTTSVVIIFFNEGLTPLLRNINSIINRTPEHILEEILLVDDCSDKEDLKSQLDWQVEMHHGLVKVIRNEKRQGLIQARVTGAKHAKGEVLVFLDAHCEVNVNWLPPLLEPILRNRKTVTIPIIDSIDKNTFAYKGNYNYDSPGKGIFDWGLLNKEISLPAHEMEQRQSKTSPYRTPSHQGGLFAIERNYFREIGYYDDGLIVWGGENHDLSFKVWLCGGMMLWIPCSRIGHIFRNMPDRLGGYVPPRKAYSMSNLKRVAEIWFDDPYKEFFYTIHPNVRYLDMGNISKQLELKKSLGCESFEWYMDYVAFDVFRHYPAPPPNLHWGELVNSGTSKCLVNMNNRLPSTMLTRTCEGRDTSMTIRLNMRGRLSLGERCIVGDINDVTMIACKLGRTDGPWEYKTQDKLLYNTEFLRCLGQHPVTKKVLLLPCDAKNTYLQWTFKRLAPEYYHGA